MLAFMLVYTRVNACFELRIVNGTSTDVTRNLVFERTKITKHQKALIFIHSVNRLGVNMQSGG